MRRKLLLAGVALAVFDTQAIWVTFSPASSLVADELGVSNEAVGLLALVFLVLFLILSIPAGLLLDRRFKRWLSIGVTVTGLAGLLRILFPHNYYWLLSCQILGGVGQALLINSFAPFASRVYPEKRGMVVSLLSLSMYLGIIYALGSGRWLYEAYGLTGLLAPVAAISLAAIAVYWLAIRGASFTGDGQGKSVLEEMREVVSMRELWILGSILGLGVALFDNMSIWLEPVLATVDLGAAAGPSVALSIIMGLAGIAVLPSIAIRRSKRSLYIRIAALFATLVFTTLALRTSWLGVMTLIPALGLIMLPAYPIIMEWISTFYPVRIHGSSSGFIGFVSRIFTVTLATVSIFFIGSPTSYFAFLASLAAAALMAAVLLPSDR